jgi:4-hydroxy 2-oxovalerate aldolase/long-chain acyl-CoA synthetase
MKQEINLLDTTLRDGSYSINFQFTASDTSLIASGLEQAGLKFIEIGHGIGLRASESGRGTAAELDEDYLRAAAESVRKAR